MSGELIEKPVLQVLGQKKIAGAQGPDRYRLLVSDSKFSVSSAMLATQLNDKVSSGEMDIHSIIRLDKYICNPIQNDRRVMILLELTVLASGSEVENRIGSPQPLRGEQNPRQQMSEMTKPSEVSSSTPAPVPVAAPAQSNQNASSAKSSFYNANNSQAQPSPRNANNSKVYNGGAPSGFIDTPSTTHPISSLTPYQNRWTIRGRVTQKSAIRTWSNSRGEGKLFSIVLADESGEIRATAFTQELDKFYNLIEVNKVYYIRKATLKTADKRFSSVNNDYEMTFNSETEVSPCEDGEDIAIPGMTFNFIPINQLESSQPNSVIDVIGVVKNVDDLKSITTKAGKELKKRDVMLVDESEVQVRLTLWSNDAETFDGTGSPVVAIKGCRLSDWGGRSLSVLGSSQIIINPDTPEAHRLRGWFDEVGTSANYKEYQKTGDSGNFAANSETNWKTFADVKAQNLGQDKADFFTTKGTIVFLKKENCMYMSPPELVALPDKLAHIDLCEQQAINCLIEACPSGTCNKKVVDQGNSSYRCEKCNQTFPNFKWRLILSANIADFSDNHWVTCFQDTAEKILGQTSDEIGKLKESNEAAFDHLFAEANFKSFVFRMRSKMETFNDESRLKTVVVQASPVGSKDYNNRLISDIEAILGPRKTD